MICCQVDDYCWGGNQLFKVEVIDLIKKKFEISKQDVSVFKYLGLNISQHPNEIQVLQHDYTNGIEKLTIPESRLKNDPLNEDESHYLQVLAGQLNWLSIQTRPDIAFGNCQISVNMHKATIKELYNASKTINKAKSEKVGLRLTDIGDLKKAKTVAYSDASFANLPEGKSQGAYIVFLVGENRNAVPLPWRSRKVKRVLKH